MKKETVTIMLVLVAIALFSIGVTGDIIVEGSSYDYSKTIDLDNLGEGDTVNEIDLEFDYNDPESYTMDSFYTDTAYSTPADWDWNQVDWDKVDFTREDMYLVADFYNKIPVDKVSELNFDSPNFDHDQMDGQKYIEGMNCIGCNFDRGSTTVVYSSQGISSPDSGNFVPIPGSYPAHIRITTDSDGRFIVGLPTSEGSPLENMDISNMGIVTLDVGDGQAILSEGNVISGGRIGLDETGLYLDAFTADATIDGMRPKTDVEGIVAMGKYVDEFADPDFKAYIFTDAGDHNDCGCNYIGIDASTGQMNAGSDGTMPMIVSVNQDNPIFRMRNQNEGTFLLAPGASMTADNRDDEGAIPLIESSGDLEISGRRTQTTINEEGVNTELLGEGNIFDMPFELHPYDKEGNLMLGTEEEPKKLVVDEFGNFGFIGLDEEFGLTEGSDTLKPRLIGIRGMEDTTQQIIEASGASGSLVDKRHFRVINDAGEIEFEIISTDHDLYDAEIAQVTQVYFNDMTSGMQEVVTDVNINLMTQENRIAYCGNAGSGACANRNGGFKFFLDEQSLNTGTMMHEATHLMHFVHDLRDDPFTSTVISVASALGHDQSQSYERFKEEHENSPEFTLEGFTGKLREITGTEIYDATEVVDGTTVWKDTGTTEPRYGCSKAYACTDHLEIIANLYGDLYNNPEKVRRMVTPGDEYYSPNTIKILELGLSANMISQESYNSITDHLE